MGQRPGAKEPLWGLRSSCILNYVNMYRHPPHVHIHRVGGGLLKEVSRDMFIHAKQVAEWTIRKKK